MTLQELLEHERGHAIYQRDATLFLGISKLMQVCEKIKHFKLVEPEERHYLTYDELVEMIERKVSNEQEEAD